MIYLDTSAFVKLVRAEQETAALRDFLTTRRGMPLVSSVLLVVETRRAVLREDPSLLAGADLLLTRIGRVDIVHAVIETASRLPGAGLRSLDAIHLATALLMRDGLDGFVTYDRRLASVAGEQGLPVRAPA
ncbi:type II toxin-antitoxin system VapC family toxin [Frankia sp. Cr1]|uniref:type II toxin-antitoxin system VapC family toxin n=1 Tax=Frankia sp. Cr1 TaxID=3073931 RepID=UPI002AD3180C|nr:type II toxin-antitoxin system VapC family toxin [Frankia sp. Cr1]